VYCSERAQAADGPCVVEIDKPRDTVLDVTVKDDVDNQGDDVIVIDSIYDAGTADRFVRHEQDTVHRPINILSRCRTSYSRCIISCSHR